MEISRKTINDEFLNISFGDKRLKERFLKLMEVFDATPQGLLSIAITDRNDLKAAYRFFSNPRATASEIVRSHRERAAERSKEHPVLLAIQDSTSLHLHSASNTDIGLIGDLRSDAKGLNVHSTIITTPKGLPIGIGDIFTYERKRVVYSHAHDRKHASQKESGRWLKSIADILDEDLFTSKLVWIADREADFWDYFTIFEERKQLFIQRVRRNRKICESNLKCFEYVDSTRPIGQITLALEGRGGRNSRPRREVVCEVRSACVNLIQPNYAPDKDVATFPVQCIHVKEIENSEEQNEEIEWYLFTNIPCETTDEILEKVSWYSQRWRTEELYKIVKSGCNIEEMRLSNKSKLEKLMTILFIVARRILWITMLMKTEPEAPCSVAFEDIEWKVMRRKKSDVKSLWDQCPSLSEMVRWVANLGGFREDLKREPGITTLWRGLRRLNEMLEGIEIAAKFFPP